MPVRRNFIRRVLLVAMVCHGVAFSGSVALGQQRLAPLPVETALGEKSLADWQQIDLSPNGQWVAYVLKDESRVQVAADERHMSLTESGVKSALLGCDIWITNTRTGESRNVTNSKGTSWAPLWSPDGKYLAFVSDRSGQTNLWLWETESGVLRKAADVAVFFDNLAETARWTRDAAKILIDVLPEGMSIEDELDITTGTSRNSIRSEQDKDTTAVVYTSTATAIGTDDKALRDGAKSSPGGRTLVDVALIEVSTGKFNRVARRVSARNLQVSSDGKNVAYLDFQRMDMQEGYSQVYSLVVVNLISGLSKVLASDLKESQGLSLSWSPDSKLLAYTTVQGDCYLVPADGGSPRKATTAVHPKFDGSWRPPLWNTAGKNLYFLAEESLWGVSITDGSAKEVARIPGRKLHEIISAAGSSGFWSPDARSMYVVTGDNENKRVGVYRIDLVSGEPSKILEEDKTYGWASRFTTSVSRDGRNVVWLAQDALRPEDLWIAEVEFKNAKRLTKINPEFDKCALGETRLISWRSGDGELLHGGLMLPAGYEKGKRYPLVVYIYGGAKLSEAINQFGGAGGRGPGNLQLLGTRGYAVLFPDSITNVGTPMRDIAKSVLPGIDKVIELGVADPDRVGVIGHSYGGYSTLALITQSTRFKAAVSADGTGDLVASYGQMYNSGWSIDIGAEETGQGKMGGSPWQVRERYIENSPFFYLDRVQTPVLLIHGAADSRVPAWLGDQIFVGLRRLGKEVTYVKYKGEEHSPYYWSSANQLDYCNRIIAWFDKYLKPAQPRN